MNDIEEALVERQRTRLLGEVYTERIEPGDDARETSTPPGYEQHGEWVWGHDDYSSIRSIGSNTLPAFPAPSAPSGSRARSDHLIPQPTVAASCSALDTLKDFGR